MTIDMLNDSKDDVFTINSGGGRAESILRGKDTKKYSDFKTCV